VCVCCETEARFAGKEQKVVVHWTVKVDLCSWKTSRYQLTIALIVLVLIIIIIIIIIRAK